MASILEDVTVSQAYDFCHHRGAERVKTRGRRREPDRQGPCCQHNREERRGRHGKTEGNVTRKLSNDQLTRLCCEAVIFSGACSQISFTTIMF